MSEQPQVILEQQEDYRFTARFESRASTVVLDENPPLGNAAGPSPAQLLVAAVANCLSDSLLFALRKFKQSPEPLRTEGWADIGRNAEGRLRVLAIRITLHLGVPASALEHLDRVLAQFEGFCTVGQSVAQGIPLQVTVQDSTGAVLKAPA
ncbi:MAG: OsmC family protein [Betaproteobacteria bacterium]|nr:OsmC family protein [Betaproteobacteria bacterium]MDE1989208.1 OsmC family protein [Betaproteobacteria bacterium]MDE2623189.1 OsmC family protein [Betaproteobacteria bacterium]